MNTVIDMEKALEEKEIMQKHFVREHGYESSVLLLLIAYFEEQMKKNDNMDKRVERSMDKIHR